MHYLTVREWPERIHGIPYPSVYKAACLIIQVVLVVFRSRHLDSSSWPSLSPQLWDITRVLSWFTNSHSLGPILPCRMHLGLFGFGCGCSGWEYLTIRTSKPSTWTKSQFSQERAVIRIYSQSKKLLMISSNVTWSRGPNVIAYI